MNLCIDRFTDVPGARLEDEVVLLGTSGDEQISAETMGEWAETINYEIVTRHKPPAPAQGGVVLAQGAGGRGFLNKSP